MAGLDSDCASGAQGNCVALEAALTAVFAQEEAALGELQSLIVKMPQALVGADARELLDALQRIEEVGERLSRLHSTLNGLATQMNDVDQWESHGNPAMAAGRFWQVTTVDLRETRHRLLGMIAGIAQQNDANAELVAGLVRAGSTTIDMLRNWQETEVDPSFRHGSHSGNRRAIATFDLQA